MLRRILHFTLDRYFISSPSFGPTSMILFRSENTFLSLIKAIFKYEHFNTPLMELLINWYITWLLQNVANSKDIHLKTVWWNFSKKQSTDSTILACVTCDAVKIFGQHTSWYQINVSPHLSSLGRDFLVIIYISKSQDLLNEISMALENNYSCIKQRLCYNTVFRT